MSNTDDQAFIESHLLQSARVKHELCAQSVKILEIVDVLHSVFLGGGRLYSCGNGGSTCDAMHLAEELVARYSRQRPGIPAQHLCDPAAITCWANDYSFESVFARQVSTLLTDKDVLVVFSTSGNSTNILKALAAANALGAETVALLGKHGGKAKSLAKNSLVIESDSTAHIQEAHIAVAHILCDRLENRLFPE